MRGITDEDCSLETLVLSIELVIEDSSLTIEESLEELDIIEADAIELSLGWLDSLLEEDSSLEEHAPRDMMITNENSKRILFFIR